MKIKKHEMSFLWTQGKINDLISLYQTSECLWNVLTEDYKSREKREIAISSICSTLNITREQFSKKIHNLRNQFNYEAKKVQQRNDNLNISYRSKWEYYEKLLFLKTVITPRPGPNYILSDYEVQNSSNSEFISIESVKPKKSQLEIVHTMDTKSGTIDQNVQIYKESQSTKLHNAVERQTSENTYPIRIQRAVNVKLENLLRETSPEQTKQKLEQPQHKIIKTEKRQETLTRTRKKQLISSLNEKCQENTKQEHCTSNDSPPKKIIKYNQSFENSNKSSHYIKASTQEIQEQQQPQRDEFDLFGEFVANELKNLNHDISKKKLKRRIMRAMLDIANEDDQLY